MLPDPTLSQVLDIVIYVGSIAGAVAAIGILLRYLVVRPIRRWIGEVAGHTRQLTKNEGSHVADRVDEAVDLSQQTLTAVGELRGKVDSLEQRHDRDLSDVWKEFARRKE